MGIFDSSKNKISQLEQQLDEKDEQISNLRQMLIKYKGDVYILVSKNEDLMRENKELILEREELQKKTEELEKILEEEKHKHYLSKCNIKHERSKKEECMAEIDALEHENFMLKIEIETLKKKKIHRKILTFSPLSEKELKKISQE